MRSRTMFLQKYRAAAGKPGASSKHPCLLPTHCGFPAQGISSLHHHKDQSLPRLILTEPAWNLAAFLYTDRSFSIFNGFLKRGWNKGAGFLRLDFPSVCPLSYLPGACGWAAASVFSLPDQRLLQDFHDSEQPFLLQLPKSVKTPAVEIQHGSDSPVSVDRQNNLRV